MTRRMTRRIDWNRAVTGVPTRDRLEGLNLEKVPDLETAVEGFIHDLEFHKYLAWEVVIREEQGLHLDREQQVQRDQLFAFPDEDDDDLEDPASERILTIDELERPAEPWYETFRKIVSHLPVGEFQTAEYHYELIIEGWDLMMEALDEHGEALSLPEGVSSPEEVIPPEIRHRLWLRTCLDPLEGIGQDEHRTLANPDEHWRIESFVESLKLCKDNVCYLDLTPERLLAVLVLPEKDEPIFTRMFMDAIGLESMSELIADRL